MVNKKMYNIYGKQGCSACIQAQQLLDSKGIQYTYLSLGKDYTMADFTLMTTQRSFPYIEEVGSDHTIEIGTFQDLKIDLEQGELS